MAENRKQIRVYVDSGQWYLFKAEVSAKENDSTTLERLLAELTALRCAMSTLADTDIAQLKDTVAELSQIHPNPLVAVGICLGRQQPICLPPEPSPESASNTVLADLDEDFIDNSGDY